MGGSKNQGVSEFSLTPFCVKCQTISDLRHHNVRSAISTIPGKSLPLTAPPIPKRKLLEKPPRKRYHATLCRMSSLRSIKDVRELVFLFMFVVMPLTSLMPCHLFACQ